MFGWKRIVHSIITIVLIIFLIWYFLPENRVMRAVDVCGYYSWKINQTCTCTPISNQKTITTTYYPNLSFFKPKPYNPEEVMVFNFTDVAR